MKPAVRLGETGEAPSCGPQNWKGAQLKFGHWAILLRGVQDKIGFALLCLDQQFALFHEHSFPP